MAPIVTSGVRRAELELVMFFIFGHRVSTSFVDVMDAMASPRQRLTSRRAIVVLDWSSAAAGLVVISSASAGGLRAGELRGGAARRAPWRCCSGSGRELSTTIVAVKERRKEMHVQS
jgi:hypothetical protein